MNSSPITAAAGVASREAVLAGMEQALRVIAAGQAQLLRGMAAADAIAAAETARIPSGEQREREMPLRGMAAEVAAVLRRSDHGMRDRMHDATTLVTGFPATVAALAEGLIEMPHVRIMLEAGARITDPEARARFEQAALVVAQRETPGRARPIILMLAQKLDPVPMAERHAEAVSQRRVWVRDLEDGMAELGARLPAVLAYAIRDRLTEHAREITAAHRQAATDAEAAPDKSGATATEVRASDRRTMDQIRTDVLSDLLLTGHATAPVSSGSSPETAAITAHVQIIIPAATLAGTGRDPAELVGYGPIDPDTARHLAATADVWERVFTSPTTGAVQQVDTYRPSEAMRRLLNARDEHCRFPGCRRPAGQCDHDHTIDAALGGPTCVTNLENLCPGRHHPVKHGTAWTVVQKPDGILEWTSPTGRVYVDIPRRVLEFMAVTAIEEPAPF